MRCNVMKCLRVDYDKFSMADIELLTWLETTKNKLSILNIIYTPTFLDQF